MKYTSTSGRYTVDLRTATLRPICPDGSLYLPSEIPHIPMAYFNNIAEMTLQEIAYVVANTLLGDAVDAGIMKRMVDKAFAFDMPLVNTAAGYSVLELFHGPTLAFKDVGARFMAEFLIEAGNPAEKAIGLVATTGNTGAAVAHAFAPYADRMKIVTLYPKGALTRAERQQITTAGSSVVAAEVTGSISKCREMARNAAADEALLAGGNIVLLNTPNVLRLYPQIVFYFQAYARLKEAGRKADGFCVSIPSGNLSNLASAIIARKMGLPMGQIIAASAKPGEPTPAKAMVADNEPTNLTRVLKLSDASCKEEVSGVTFAEIDSAEISRAVIDSSARGYLPDPHTAAAIAALKYAPEGDEQVVLATAHPAKSLDAMTAITGRALELPLQLTRFMAKGSTPAIIPPTQAALNKLINTLR